ncbi:MAG: chlorite dismutase family protein [Chloroherpetonaceae bacterium]|nr:chlorite dismutase family protein [Chthonomonadaceae bacterium]MDW8208071.1 chlorite dismutase family protein [Chloroherpetonaceae bacterium]
MNGTENRGRTVVQFAFYKFDPAWRRLPPEERERDKADFAAAVEEAAAEMMVRCYSLTGVRGDVDLLLWNAAPQLETIQKHGARLLRTGMGRWASQPYCYLAMTKASQYQDPTEQGAPEGRRLLLRPTGRKYLFVYPFVKTRAWYLLPLQERQKIMEEHILIGHKFPSVKLNTTYSFGIDDQEFVVAFETDVMADFLDLVMALRETESSKYTLRDTPIFTCVQMPLRDALDAIG